MKFKKIISVLLVIMMIFVSSVSSLAVSLKPIRKFTVDGYEVERVADTKGTLIQLSDGHLKMIGGPYTNGQIVNGKRDGNHIRTKKKFMLKNQRIDTKFTVHSKGYAIVGSAVYGNGGGFTTQTLEVGKRKLKNTVLVKDNETLYSTLIFTDNNIQTYVCKGNYFGEPNCNIIGQRTLQLSQANKQRLNSPYGIDFFIRKNEDGTKAYIVAKEIHIRKYIGDYEVRQINKTNSPLIQLPNRELKMIGGKYTNGKVVNGVRDGNHVQTLEKFALANKRVDLKFTVHSNKYARVNAGVFNYFNAYKPMEMSVGQKTGDGIAIDNNDTIYKTIFFNLKKSVFKEYICRGNYYQKSGNTLIRYREWPMTSYDIQRLKNSEKFPIEFYISHNEDNEKAYIIGQEIHISKIIPPITHLDSHLPNISSASGWAKEEIQLAVKAGLYAKKIMEGNFKSNATREEFAELVVKMYEKLGGTITANVNPFSDTTNPEIIKAYNAGIIKGMTATTFEPNRNMTREQMCVMIMRAIRNIDKSYEFKTGFQKQYADLDKISDWAKSDVEILNAYKIINGDGVNLRPRSNVTKEESVLLLYRSYMKFK